MKRRRPAPGVPLAQSDQSGFAFPMDEMVQQWDGQLVHWSEEEPRHPQDFVRARPDPSPVKNPRPRAGQDVGSTTSLAGDYCPVRYLNGIDQWGSSPALSVLMQTYAAVGVASVGCTLQVW